MNLPKTAVNLTIAFTAFVFASPSEAVTLPNISTFANDNAGTLPAGWMPAELNAPAVSTAKAAPGDSKSVAFTGNTQGMQLPLPATGSLQWDFWVYPTGGNRSLTVGTIDSLSRFGVWITFGVSSGQVSYYANNVWTAIPSISYAANQWYRVRIVTRLTPSPTFDFYLSSPGSPNLPSIPQGRNLPLRDPATSGFAYARVSTHSFASTAYFDNSALQAPAADGFESNAIGLSVPTGWVNAGTTVPEILGSGADNSSRSLKLFQSSNGVSLPFSIADTVTAEFKFSPASLSRTLTFTLMDQDNRWGPYLSFGSTLGKLSYFANNVWTIVPGVTLSAVNAWYRVKLVARTLPTPGFDVYVSASNSDVLPASPQGVNLPLRDPLALDFASLNLNAFALAAASLVDHVEINPEPGPATPNLNLPVVNAVSILPTPSFDWNGSSSADVYETEIATDVDFTNVIDADRIAISRYVADQDLSPGIYYWRVRSRGLNGLDGLASAYTPGRKLTIQTPSNIYTIPASASAAQIQSIISNAATPAVINFAADATYTLDTAAGSYMINLTSKNDLIINGNGAKILFTNPMAGLARLISCKRILLRDLTIDHATAPFSVGTIVSTTAGGNFTVSLDNGMQPFNSPIMLTHWTWGVLLDPAVPGKMKNSTDLVIPTVPGNVTQNGNLYTLKLANPGQIGQFTVGTKYIQFARENGGVSLVYSALNTEDLTCLRITNYSISGAHYVNTDGSNFKILKCRSLIKSGRWFGGNADGLHVRSNSTGPWMEGCEFQGIGDDAVALYSKGMFITQKINNNTLRLNSDFFNLAVGHTFTVFDPRTGSAVAQNLKVTAITPVGNPVLYDVAFTPAFTGAIQTSDSNPLKNDQVFGQTRINNGFAIRGNTFSNIRRFGSVIRACHGVIENNTYESVSSVAINIRNEPDTWRNGLFSSDILIANNTIRNSGFDNSAQSLGQINIALYKLGHQFGSWRAHQRISIVGNVISNWQEDGIQVRNAKDIEILNNTITADPGFNFTNPRPHHAIHLNNVENAAILSNTISDPRPLTPPSINVQNSTGVFVSP